MDLLEKFSVVNRRRLEVSLGIISFSFPICNALSFKFANVDQNFYQYYWVIMGFYLMVVLITLLFTRIVWHKSMRFFITSEVLKFIILNTLVDVLHALMVEKSITHVVYSIVYDLLAAVLVFFLNYNSRRSEWGLFRALILVQIFNTLVDTCFYAVSFYNSAIFESLITNLFSFFLNAMDTVVDLLVSWTLFQFAFHKLWDMKSDTFMRPKAILAGMPGSFDGTMEYETIDSDV